MSKNSILESCRHILISLVIVFSLYQPSYSSQRVKDNPTLLSPEIDDLYKKGYYSKAIPLAENLLSAQEKIHGSFSLKLTEPLDYLGKLQYLAGNYTRAKSQFEKSLSIKTKVLGNNVLQVAESYDWLGVLHIFFGDFTHIQRELKKHQEDGRKKVLG